MVCTVSQGNLEAGVHDLQFGPRRVPAGAYFLVMDADGFSYSQGLVIF